MTTTWPGWRNTGIGLWERPDGVITSQAPPPWPDRPHRVAVVGAEGLTYQPIAAALERAHRHKPMTPILHDAPPPDSYCLARDLLGYVVSWCLSQGVELQSLPPGWPAGAAELVDGVIDFGAGADLPGLKVWRPYPARR